MNTTRTFLALSALALMVAGPLARADESEMNIDIKFRAKIAKEKAKQATLTQMDKNAKEKPEQECGSQNIGNINTNGRVGTAPREVFIFAPNAINNVSGRGCN
jgi:hypothetical protein